MKKNGYAIFFYYCYFASLFSTTILISTVPDNVWVSIVPFTVLSLLILVIRPYINWKDNLKTVLGIVVIQCFLGVRVIGLFTESTSSLIMWYFFGCLIAVTASTIISLVTLIFYVSVFCKKEEETTQ